VAESAFVDDEEELQRQIVERFAHFAEALDAAGLGPADYLYAPLKWRLQNRHANRLSRLGPLVKVARLIFKPPTWPLDLRHADILAASSYSVSVKFLEKIVKVFQPGEALLCDASVERHAGLRCVLSAFGFVPRLWPALRFAYRVDRVLRRFGTAPVERQRIAEAAASHALYRYVARAILRAVRPQVLLIANGNRPFEFALFAEAKATAISTVLIPFAELNPKPARFLSLCRGDFDLMLPFSEHSADVIRKLRTYPAVEVVGYPCEFIHSDADDQEPGEGDSFRILHICGNNFEDEVSEMCRPALENAEACALRVRFHPRNDREEIRRIFGWVSPDAFSHPAATALSEDLAWAHAVTLVRSTVALDAMFAGLPVILLSPTSRRSEVDSHPVRRQRLAVLEASGPTQLGSILERLARDKAERHRIRQEQWTRLRAAGYARDYYGAVEDALRRFVAVRLSPVSRASRDSDDVAPAT
jgi:hypothetical protein